MALPNGAGGYQNNAGNPSEPIISLTDAPISVTGTATLTAAQLINGLLLVGSGASSAQTYTLPTVALLEAAIPNTDRIGTTFQFRVVNLGTGSGTAIIAAGTGWTVSGSLTMTIPVTTGALLVARKSGAGAWVLYRVA
jgi:hypothetical protein